METKVLSAIMKMQAAQIMLSNAGIFCNVSIDNSSHGSLEITAYSHNESEAAAATRILETYTLKGAKLTETKYCEGTSNEFTSHMLHVYISKLED